MKARVHVTLRPGVLDARGQAVHKTLTRLGFGEVEAVRIGTYIEIELAGPAAAQASADEMRARVEAMCAELLANAVLEEFRVEIVE